MTTVRSAVEIGILVRDEATKKLQAFSQSISGMERSVRVASASAAAFNRSAAPISALLADATDQAKRVTESFSGFRSEMERSSSAVESALSGFQGFIGKFAGSVGQSLEGLNRRFKETFEGEVSFSLKAGEKAFTDFQKHLDEGLSGVFATAFAATTKETHDAWEKFLKQMEASFYQSLGRMASALVQENLLAPLFKLGQEAVGGLLSAGKSLFLAEGGLVTRPTLAVLGEAGPEVVLPLEAAGEFVKKTLVGAAQETALNEAAKQAALDAGLEIGVEKAAAGAAAAAGLTTGAALFVFGDAINAALGGQSAIRAIGDIAFGGRGKRGLIEKGLGALGIGAFRKKGGEFNLPMIQALYAEALAAPPVPPFGFNELMARLGSDDPDRARAFLAPYLGEGGFITGPTLALIGERGREAVLPLDSPSSMRGLTESLRPIVRGLFEEMGLRGGPGAGGRVPVVIQLVLNGRAIQEISREVDVTNERRPRTQRALRPGWAGV